MSQWINFMELRQRMNFKDVLEAYSIEFTVKGDQALAICPLPTHQGDRRSKSFSANLKRGIWQCFRCGARGNVLDFAVRMDGLSPDNTADIRKTALWLDERFQLGCVGNGPPSQSSKATKKPPTRTSNVGKPPQPKPSPSAKINEPLDFELKGLNASHPYLLDRGFLPSTIERFGLGYCSRGFLTERVAIPLHNEHGQLVGYAGRLANDTAITLENSKYRFPSERDRHGIKLEFRKSLLVYNIHRVAEHVDHLVVVSGFASAWWIHQAGFPNVVATMGAGCSPEQSALILAKTNTGAKITVITDGDAAGDRFAQSVFFALGPHRCIRWAKANNGQQPTDMSADVLSTLLPE